MNALEFSFCPQCGHKLENVEKHCPFCGYRLSDDLSGTGLEKDKHEVPEDAEDLGLDAHYYCPTCNTVRNGDEKFCANCGMWFDAAGGQEQLSHPVNLGPYDGSDEKLPEAKINVTEKVIDLHPKKETEEVQKEIQPTEDSIPPASNLPYPPPYQDPLPPQGRKKRTGIIVLFVILAIFLASVITVLILQANCVVSIPGLNGVFNCDGTTVNDQPIATTQYYYCYATANIKKKNTVIITSVFSLNQEGNSAKDAERSFKEFVAGKYPAEAESFIPVVVCRFPSMAEATDAWSKTREQFRTKKYTFREINIQ